MRARKRTSARSHSAPRVVSGSLAHPSISASSVGDETKIASRTSGRATISRRRLRRSSRSRASAAGSPGADPACVPSAQSSSSRNGSSGVRRAKNPEGVNDAAVSSRSDVQLIVGRARPGVKR